MAKQINIIQLKNNNDIPKYPITSSACVGMSDRSGNLDDALKKIKSSIKPGIPEPTDDNKLYARKRTRSSMDGEWVLIPEDKGIPEPTADGNLYARKRTSPDEEGKWALIPEDKGIPEPAADGNLYARKRTSSSAEGEWALIPASGGGISDVSDSNIYARTQNAWTRLEPIDDNFINNVFT